MIKVKFVSCYYQGLAFNKSELEALKSFELLSCAATGNPLNSKTDLLI